MLDAELGTDVVVYRVVGPLAEGWTVEGAYVAVEGEWRLADFRVYPHRRPMYDVPPEQVRPEDVPPEPSEDVSLEQAAVDRVQAQESVVSALAAMGAPYGLVGERIRDAAQALRDMRQALEDSQASEALYEVADPTSEYGRALQAAQAAVPPLVDRTRALGPLPPRTLLSKARLEYLQAAYLQTQHPAMTRPHLAALIRDLDPDKYLPTPEQVRDRLKGARIAGFLTSPGVGLAHESRLDADGIRYAKRFLNADGSIKETYRSKSRERATR